MTTEPAALTPPEIVKRALACKCPRCGEGPVYKAGTYLDINETCPVCGFALAKNDSADGPAVFLIFVLGFLLIPAAVIVQFMFEPPAWLQVIVWSIIAIGLTLWALRPLKAFVIALQYKYRPHDWSGKA